MQIRIYNGKALLPDSCAFAARSAKTDVSAFWLKRAGCQKHHADFNQNAETSVAAEPNAIKSRCKIHNFVNLQREFQNLQREFSLPAKMREKHQNLQRDFKVFFYGFRMDFFNQNAETSVAAEPNASANNQNFIKKIIFF